MSGGFFRGTSADQDTRFSNKQAKFLKSQKFAAELEHLVDMTKVKMDVIRPWIANRVTELIGFEDEVLINFIFGLLEGKDVDGKQVQIQLTGFMEKNTGKFMKELWSLLLSAQKNISGIPQQFLDAKEEETRKKKAEADRINQEIQKRKKKDNREMEQGRQKGLDGETDDSRAGFHAFDAISKHLLPKTNLDIEDSKEKAHKLRGRDRIASSPHGLDRSPTHHRKSPHSPRQRSKSLNNRSSSRSGTSTERYRSRSVSRSPRHRRRSPPVDRRSFSPVHSAHGKYSSRYARSPPRRRPHYSRWRSPSPLRYRSRSPVRRGSQTPIQHKSISPVRHKFPSRLKRRSRSPRYRSPSPAQRRFSPGRSPPHRRSPSPSRRRLLLPQSSRYHRSPVRSPRRRCVAVSPHRKNRSLSPYRSHSSFRNHRSSSREPVTHANGSDHRRYKNNEKDYRVYGRRSPDAHAFERGESKLSGGEASGPSVRPPLSTNLRSPQRDVKLPSNSSHKISTLSPTEESVRSQLDSPVYERNENMNQRSDLLQGHKEQRVHQESPESSADDDGVPYQKNSSQKQVLQPACILEEIEYGPGRLGNTVSHNHASVRQSSSRRYGTVDSPLEGRLDDAHANSKKFDTKDMSDRKISHSPAADDVYRMEYKKERTRRSTKIVEHADKAGRYESDAEVSMDSRHRNLGSRKKKREEDESSPRHDEDVDNDSPSDERKQPKRGKKEEKRLRKEERRRRREERHRRREERRAAKMKAKSSTISSDLRENDRGADQSDGDDAYANFHQSGAEEAESEQKRLEIELRKKALESLRAKKAAVH